MQERELQKLLALGDEVVERARGAGADVAEAVASGGSHLSTTVRLGEPELVEEAGSRGLGLRVMIGSRVAVTYTSDLTEAGRARLVEDAIELARLSQPDEFAGPPDAAELADPAALGDLDLYAPPVDGVDGAAAPSTPSTGGA